MCSTDGISRLVSHSCFRYTGVQAVRKFCLRTVVREVARLVKPALLKIIRRRKRKSHHHEGGVMPSLSSIVMRQFLSTSNSSGKKGAGKINRNKLHGCLPKLNFESTLKIAGLVKGYPLAADCTICRQKQVCPSHCSALSAHNLSRY